MATSGQITGSVRSSSGATSSYKYWCEWAVNSQSIAGNTSNITVKLKVQCTAFANSAWNRERLPIVSLSVNGKTVSPTLDYIDTRNYVVCTFATWTGNVSHTIDGSLSCRIVGSFDINDSTVSSLQSGSLSGSASLPMIPRASTVAATNADIGSVSTIAITRAVSSYRHKITYQCSGISETTIVSDSAATSIPWTVPEAIYATIPSAAYATVTIKCYTYSSGQLIGTNTTTMRATASPLISSPEVSGTVEDINAATLALTGSAAKLIRYRSTARCTITAAAKNAASIVSRTVNGAAIPSSGILEIPQVEASQFAFAAVDSRGYPGSATVSPQVVDYVPLTIDPIFSRLSPTSNQVNVEFSGNFFSGSFGAAENTLTIRFRYREAGTENWSNYSQISVASITIDAERAAYRSNGAVSLGEFYDYRKSYDFEIQAQDGSGSNVLTSVSVTGLVTRGEPVFSWGNDAFDFSVPVSIRSDAGEAVLSQSKIEIVKNGVSQGYINSSGYVVGRWLQTTADTHLSSKASKFCVLDSSGWVYHRTAAEILSDLSVPYVESEGDSGNWHYRKYSDGFCILMFTGTVTGSSTIQLLGGYNSDASVTYPFALKEVYSAHANARLGSGTGFGYVAAYGSSCSVYAVGNQNSRTVNMSITIFGRWK